jgi:hypothetical protein
MKERLRLNVRRRDLLGAVIVGAAVAATTMVLEPAAAAPGRRDDKRKARYRGNSPAIQDFYRVNRYPAR